MALAALLAALLAGEAIAPLPQPAPLPPPHAAAARPAAIAPASSADAQAVILARPLFRPDRRPPQAAPAVLDETVPRLSAIVITGAGRSAIFIADDGSAAVLRLGGHIGAYQLQTIAPDSVSLVGPNGAISVHPSFTAAAPAPSPNPPAAPQPMPPPTGLFSNMPQ